MIDATQHARKLLLRAMRMSRVDVLGSHLVRGVGAVMMLHRVTAAPVSPLGVTSHLTVHPDFLDALLTDMRRLGYAFVSMDEVVETLRRGRATRSIAAFTADDGYRDNLTEALPVFEAHDAPLTVYVSTGLINGTVLPWWEVVERCIAASDRLEFATSAGPIMLDCRTPQLKLAAYRRVLELFTSELPEVEQMNIVRQLVESAGVQDDEPIGRTFLDPSEVARMSRHRLVTIGAHTRHHYNLRRLDRDTALTEMTAAATELGALTGTVPRHMAYPYGYREAVGSREVGLAVEAGFESAVTTRHGVLRGDHGAHLHALPRLSVNGRYQSIGAMRTLLSGITTPLANRGRLTVTV